MVWVKTFGEVRPILGGATDSLVKPFAITNGEFDHLLIIKRTREITDNRVVLLVAIIQDAKFEEDSVCFHSW